MELNLVEEDLLSALGMASDRLTNLAHSQAVFAGPLASHACLGACGFDFMAIICVEELLPADIEAGREVAHIHQALLFKPLQDRGVHAAGDFATIGYWCSTTLLRRQRAVEVDLLR